MRDRPVCKCHGEPMVKNGVRRDGVLAFRCRVKNNRRVSSWGRDNPERRRERKRRNRMSNPDLYRAHGRKHAALHRARIRGSSIGPAWTRQDLIDRDGLICYLCTKSIDITLRGPNPESFSEDHVIPLSKGGPHTFENVRPAHLGCNSAKHNRVAA